MAVSLREVALQAGVSTSTVSRVLSGDARVQIAAQTQKLVRATALEMGYQPNRFARSLITGRTHTLGLMISRLSNPFFVSLIEGAESAAKAGGYKVLLDADGSHADDYLQSGRLTDWPVDGVIMWTWADQQLSDFLGGRALDTPVVYVGERSRPNDAPTLVYDVAAGAKQAIAYALERGARRPAQLVPYGPGDWERPELRAQIYNDACAKAGLQLETIVASPRAETREAGFNSALVLAQRPAHLRPDVVLCHNDIMAIGFYHGLLRAGVKVPEEIGVIGFDGLEEGRFLDKRLTTVHIPGEKIGERAVQMLLQQLSGESERREVTVSTQFVRGETA